MKPAHFLLILALVTNLFCGELYAQGKPKQRKPAPVKTGNSETTQWWIGVRGGINFSQAQSDQAYSVFSYINETTEGDNAKKYKPYSLPGLQFGFIVSYEFIRGLSANIFPTYSSFRYEYGNTYRWYSSEAPSKRVVMSYNFQTRLQYVEFPLTIKYELMRGKFKPYIQAGGFYGFNVDAIKKVQIRSVDEASGADTEKNVTNLSVGIDDRTTKNNYGLIGGVGFTYNIGNARFGLEVNYQYGMKNIDNGEKKYYDNQLLSGVYDVPDDAELKNIKIALSCIIPLRFITSKDYIPL